MPNRVLGRPAGRTGHAIAATASAIIAAAGAAISAAPALAGGSPENVLIVVDPSSAESMYVANYYRAARDIPDGNVLYMDSDAANYAAWSAANGNLDGFLGQLVQSRVEDHIDYVAVAPGPNYYVEASGYISDGCYPVNRFAIASVYTMAYVKDDILAKTWSSQQRQGYYSTDSSRALAFDSGETWYNGEISADSRARRYYIGAMLGYTGSRGNTVPEILEMIDRSVGADGSFPAGTYYFMNNTSDAARNVRATQYAAALADLATYGGAGEKIDGILPYGRHDVLGIVTGFASADILGADFTFKDGAFADHLTSYAGTFEDGSQTKMSDWIRKGASGTSGTVDEPCNYRGKFPHSKLHVSYWRGLSMGESWFRSMNFVPFQPLFYGDPMTRPWTYIPEVEVADAPTGEVSGTVTLTPTASTDRPDTSIDSFDLLIDGVLTASAPPGSKFSIDTTALAEGWHDLRVLAYDNSIMKSAGRWVGTLDVGNDAHDAAITGVTPPAGGLTQKFDVGVSVAGGGATEVRLLHNGRVVASGDGSASKLTVYGQNLGAGKARVVAEALFDDGSAARSEPVEIDVAYTGGSPSGAAPVAYGYTKFITDLAKPFVVELPAAFDTAQGSTSFTLLSSPAQSTVGPGSLGYRVMTPKDGATGSETFTFRVNSSSGMSNTATITLVYTVDKVCGPDCTKDGKLNINDFICFQSEWTRRTPYGDFNGDGKWNINDFIAFQLAFAKGCE